MNGACLTYTVTLITNAADRCIVRERLAQSSLVDMSCVTVDSIHRLLVLPQPYCYHLALYPPEAPYYRNR